ncbi:MAG: DUF3450 family protein [Deltaproteobacteria bacterium]|nr:DUF3450 family protein [Deltaproteobacteria bacterium]
MANQLKKITVILSVMFLVALSGSVIAAEEWGQVAQQIENDQTQAVKDAAETEQLATMDSAALEQELAQLKAEEKRAQGAYDALRAEFERLQKEEANLRTELTDEQAEIDSIEGTIRGTADDAITLSRDNFITAEYPDRTEVLNELSTQKKFPGLEGIKTLVDFFFQEMEEQGQIKRRTGEFIGPDGKITTGDIIRIGRITAYYRLPDGNIGFLLPDSSGQNLIAVTGEIGYSAKKNIKAFFNETSNVAPIDPSATGGAFSEFTEGENLWEWMAKGGPVMYFIFAVACLAALIAIERTIVLGSKSRASEKVINEIKELAKQNKYKEARDYCSLKSRVPTCQMLEGVLQHEGESQEVLENSLQESILKILPKLERWLGALSLLGAIAPLLGLLGTVTGMITVFQVITTAGTGDPRLMAGGISEALLTTQFGLILAVPVMLIHHLLERQVDGIIYDMQEKGTSFIVTMIKQKA